MAVGAQGVLRHEVQVVTHKVKNLLIPKPAGCLAMDLLRTRLEEQQVAAIFQGRHVMVERLPIIADQDDSAGSGELSGDTALAQGRSRRLPGYRLGPFRLAQSFEETNPQAVSIETVDVVQHDGLIPVLVSLQVNTKGSGLAADPTDLAPQRLAHQAALAHPRWAEDHKQVQMPRAKGEDVRFQLCKGRETDG